MSASSLNTRSSGLEQGLVAPPALKRAPYMAGVRQDVYSVELTRKQESQSNGSCHGLHQRRLQADCSTCLQARQEVGDGSEPEFNWVIGKAGSLLDYKLVGVHTCISGSTSVCDSGAFERMKDGSAPSAGDKHLAKDFLMVGEMPNCSSAAVYVLKSGEGFMIASNYEALDDDRGDLM